MTDDEMRTLARNWDSLCLYAWRPHMYNPQLSLGLHRIAVPTLVLWGESDRIVTPEYGRAYAGLIPGARFAAIERAGHHPELEQPATFVERVATFLDGGGSGGARCHDVHRPHERRPARPDRRRPQGAAPHAQIVPNAAGKIDYFCVAEEAAVAKLHDQGFEVVRLRDGWYADDSGGGIVIFGHGRFWEVRDTPFTVKEAAGPAETAAPDRADPEQVNVRSAIFGV